MGVELHSRKTAVKIVDHIATQIRKELFTKIVEKSLKICTIIDEASTVSIKPVIVIFVKIKDCKFFSNGFFGCDLIGRTGSRRNL